MSTLSARDEFDDLLDRSSLEFSERILDLAGEYARPIPFGERLDRERLRLGRLIAGTSAVAEMLGRRRVLLEVKHMSHGVSSYQAMVYAADDQNLLPNVSPEKAIEDMVKRQPKLAEGYKRVQELYSKERAFALAKSSDLVVSKRVHEYIIEALRQGITLPTAEKTIADLGAWARGYGETVFRTNLATNYANGRFLEASDPDLAGFVAGLERMEIMDDATRKRPGHWHAHGLVAGVRDPIWLKLGLPGGYNCRGSYRIVDVLEARRRGLMLGSEMRRAPWPAGAYNDPGFDSRVSFELFGLVG